MNKTLQKEVWEKENYWDLAGKGSLEINHPGMRLLYDVAKGKKNILDLGCGEGTRLGFIKGRDKKLTGIDVSQTAIKKAKTKFPKINFVSGNIEELPFTDESFDLVYSAFVFEHLDQPEKVIKEAIRVLSKHGSLIIVAPNYGSPNRASPPFIGSRIKKLFLGLLGDCIRPGKVYSLHWNKVLPIASAGKYEMDWDTTVEPYLGSLAPFLKSLGLRIIKTTSCWEMEEKGAGKLQKLFRYFGECEIYPFYNWGPHLVIQATNEI